MKLIDEIQGRIDRQEPFYSFEYFPPKTSAGVDNLYARMERLAELHPLFTDVTWRAGGGSADLTLELSANAQRMTGIPTLMHMTCTNVEEEDLRLALDRAKEAGITNLLALRGDSVHGPTKGKFEHAVDLVRFIRETHGDDFCIGVAAYPEGHEDAADKKTDLEYLKEKVDAGADFIITQMFYEAQVFLDFLSDCRSIGITVPIIPGVMPIHTYGGFVRMTSFTKAHVPTSVTEALEPIKADDEAVKEYGVQMATEMCRKLLDAGVPGLHFYTLNLERSVRRILEALHIIPSSPSKRELPWRASSASNSRATENVRPIYWSNRPKSYIERTAMWDEFPNGRWGNVESPAFGELVEAHYAMNHISTRDRKAMWGECPASLQDVQDTFTKYVRGDIKVLPWCDAPLHLETQQIGDELVKAIENGFLTINSQPRVNAASSDDEIYGWGGAGGRVYQKAYVECFVSPENMKKVIERADKMPNIQYHAVDCNGHSYSNAGNAAVAVTWGVFPHKEILQPTIVDSRSFLVWKDEAFALWLSMWAALYDDDSPSSELLHSIHDNYFLVSIVDNNFVNGNIWDIFQEEGTPESA